MIADLLKSKKFRTMLAGAVSVLLVRVAGRYGIALDEKTATEVARLLSGLAAAYILAQGAADFGKERGKEQVVGADE